MLLSNAIVDFGLFYDGAVFMQIRAFLTKSQCRVSDTQLTVMACRLLVFFNFGITGMKVYKYPKMY